MPPKFVHVRSRLLVTTVPSSVYVFNEEGVNLSLQAVATIIVESINQLSVDGVAVRDVGSDEVVQHLNEQILFPG